MRFSFTSRPPRRLSKVLKCFLVAVVTVLMTAPSNKDGDDDDRLDEMNWSCLVEGSENKGGNWRKKKTCNIEHIVIESLHRCSNNIRKKTTMYFKILLNGVNFPN